MQSKQRLQPAMELNRNGSVNARNKRKQWTEAEDLELLAAVQKYGEGNWTNMLTSGFTWHRSARDLRQRWEVIRRKVGNLNLATTTTTSSIGGVQLSEAQRATRIALNFALGLPLKNSFIKSAEGTSSPHFSQSCIATKPSSISVKKPVNADLSSNPVRAAAVAAGARISTQSHVASLLRVAQVRNAIHIMPTVGSSIKSALPGCASEAYSNGLPTTSVSVQSTTQHNPISGTAMDVSTTAQANTEVPLKQGLRPALEKASSQSTTKQNSIPLKQDVHTGGMNSVADVAKLQVQEHRVSIAAGKEPSKQVKLEKAVLLNQETQESVGENESERLKAEEIICQEQMFFKLVFRDIFYANTDSVSISKDENECAGEWRR